MEKKGRVKIWDRGFHHRRTEGTSQQSRREKVFAEEWKDEAPQIVDGILTPPHRKGNPFELHKWGNPATKITRRDRAVIATLMQWLGSNVGYSFLVTALKKCGYEVIERESLQKMRDELHTLKQKAPK